MMDIKKLTGHIFLFVSGNISREGCAVSNSEPNVDIAMSIGLLP